MATLIFKCNASKIQYNDCEREMSSGFFFLKKYIVKKREGLWRRLMKECV